MERFAREDRRIARHLDVVKRKEMLELVLAKLENLRMLEGREGRREKGKKGKVNERETGWRLF